MFSLSYLTAELWRRKGRTVLTALGLAVGIGLVVTVSALSDGLDQAQRKVLEPLTGVGTDMSVARPLKRTASGKLSGGGKLSAAEQKTLKNENSTQQLRLRNLGDPGDKFEMDAFTSTSQLTFPEEEVSTIRKGTNVEAAAGALTVSALHISGKVPPKSEQQTAAEAEAQSQAGTAASAASGPPKDINVTPLTVSGVDVTQPSLGLVTKSHVASGRYFSSSADAAKREAILNTSYARRKGIEVGETVKVAGKDFKVVGLASTPVGGQASDVYIELGRLQRLSDREGRVNGVQVRATDSDTVAAVSKDIKTSLAGASVTTAQDLADRVSGSLVDAKSLSSKLGTALAIVALAATFLIASLLTLGSVNKRVRELGTLRALGWSRGKVVRQVTGEAVAQGVLGGALGVAMGVAAATAVTAFGPTLTATAGAATPGSGATAAGEEAVSTAASTTVQLTAPLEPGLLALAVGLAVLGGLLSGAAGGLRAARLRPAEALRYVD